MPDAFGDGQTSRSNPSVYFRDLIDAEVSDGADLPVIPKAIEIENNGAATLKVKMLSSKAKAKGESIVGTISVPTGTTRIFCGSVTRIYDTGSTNLKSYITAGTAGVILHLE
jgi:hypothetical protein